MFGGSDGAGILGANNAGWHTIFFNRKNVVLETNVADLTVTRLTDIIAWL